MSDSGDIKKADDLRPTAVRGMQDRLPALMRRHRRVVDVAMETARRHDFVEIDTPTLEFQRVFSRPLGEDSDIVSKEMYAFEDRGGEKLVLRPEFTAAVMRMVLNNGLHNAGVSRFCYRGALFRYERPQRGRLRQFHQVGVESIGRGDFWADYDVIVAAADLMAGLELADSCKLHLNTLGCDESRRAYRKALVGFLNERKDKLSELSRRRLATNPMRILDSKERADRELLSDAPRMVDYLTPESRRFFDNLTAELKAGGIDYEHDHGLVRGLDYYCHTVFEFRADNDAGGIGSQTAVIAGGRYDGLSEMLSGPRVPAVGWSAGVERLSLAAAEPAASPIAIAIVALSSDQLREAHRLAALLRAGGTAVRVMAPGRFNKRLKRAAGDGVRTAALLGPDEVAGGFVQVKDLTRGEQRRMSVDRFIESYR